MDIPLIMINKISPLVDENYWLKSLDTANLYQTINISDPKVFNTLTDRKCLKTFGTSIMYSPTFLPSLAYQ